MKERVSVQSIGRTLARSKLRAFELFGHDGGGWLDVDTGHAIVVLGT